MSVMYYRPQTLETIARKTLTEHSCNYLNQAPGAVPIESIIEKNYGLCIEYQYLTNNARELGRMIYDDGITTYYNRDIQDYALLRVRGGTMMIDAYRIIDMRRMQNALSAMHMDSERAKENRVAMHQPT